MDQAEIEAAVKEILGTTPYEILEGFYREQIKVHQNLIESSKQEIDRLHKEIERLPLGKD